MIEYPILLTKALAALRSLSRVVSGLAEDIKRTQKSYGEIQDYSEHRRQIRYLGNLAIRFKRLTVYKADLNFMLELYGDGRKTNEGYWEDVQIELIKLLNELDDIQNILVEKNFGRFKLERLMIIKINESKRYLKRIMNEPRSDQEFKKYLKIGQAVQKMQEEGGKALDEANLFLSNHGEEKLNSNIITASIKHRLPNRRKKVQNI